MKKVIIGVSTLVVILIGVRIIVPTYIDKSRNQVTPHQPYQITNASKSFHQSLFIGDWHSDSTLWSRDLLARAEHGHMDLPRLQAGNVALQMFTTTTKSPSNQNYNNNDANSMDNITLLAMVQGWPVRTWFNLTERAIYQAKKLKHAIKQTPSSFTLITNRQELTALISARQQGSKIVGAMLGTEGSHALEGDFNNIKKLYDEGFRMMSLQHFFDNRLGGSLHGQSKAGLTSFGRKVIEELNSQSIIIDVSHSSPQVVNDVLAISTSPIVVSHTGLHGFCPSARNISDTLMKEIAAKGGIIALGYWSAASCDTSPQQVAKQIAYGITLVGAQHISLGSDFDGAVTTGIDTSELAIITQELLALKVSKQDIKLVMGDNMKNFLLKSLPEK
ncbi:dipeptidase [Candidatus Enterovibrio escicola]|uniref:dipeptidase n=1 Tax=Candidatus Enterovibrio escicola TaxID=1927127 RepID=UPI001237E85E|nr:membrane dipeptidase [Candidatus Enterovibrio escacola]